MFNRNKYQNVNNFLKNNFKLCSADAWDIFIIKKNMLWSELFVQADRIVYRDHHKSW